MKLLSETYKELGIAFTFPIEIRDTKGRRTYFEDSKGYWFKREYDSKGNLTYYENSKSSKRGTPQIQTFDGKVVEIGGIKYELKAL
jgi:hypothetical protein